MSRAGLTLRSLKNKRYLIKMKNYLLIIAILTILSSCEWGGAPKTRKAGISKDTLSYQEQRYKKYADDCGSKPDSNCSEINITYPVFKGQPKLNDTVVQKLASMVAIDNKHENTFDALSKDFFQQDKQVKSAGRAHIKLTITGSATVARQDSGLVAIQLDGYSFTGGAHGISPTYFINWDIKTGKNLLLADVLTTGYEQPLNAVAEKIFRKEENLSDTASLSRDYFFKGGKFSLNNNFMITPLGLRFLYNQTEIKPYAAGKTEIIVPYNQIKTLLKPNTIVSQYVK